ncbi:hypothetical protein Q3G72_019260 [Acer saccharum]|nr:hypothetical protein Q3G72_019260 [Acer saccharum]
MTHALWTCPALKGIREQCGLLRDVTIGEGTSFLDFMISVCSFLDDFRKANLLVQPDSSVLRPGEFGWRPPDYGLIKVNTNAAIKVTSNKMGIGIIIRDFRGEVFAYSAQSVMARFFLAMAEALAVYRGLCFARDSGLLPCLVEFDAQMVVKIVNSGSVPLSDIGLLISDILLFLRDHPGCKVVFTSRKNNFVAHGLAKIGFSLSCDKFWMENVPLDVVSCVSRDHFGCL